MTRSINKKFGSCYTQVMMIFGLVPLIAVVAAASPLDGSWRQLGIACERGVLTPLGARVELSFRSGTTSTKTTISGTKATHVLRTSNGRGKDEVICETVLAEKWQLEGKSSLVMSDTKGTGKIVGAKDSLTDSGGAQCPAKVAHAGVRRREFRVDRKRLTLFATDIYQMGTSARLALCEQGRTVFIYERTSLNALQ